MALWTFGGGTADVTVDESTGATAGGVQLTAWTSRTGGVQVTDLYDVDGVTALPGYVTSQVSTDPSVRGRVLFKAPDAYSALFLWDGDPGHDRWGVLAVEVTTLLKGAIDKSGQALTDAASAQATADQALADAQNAAGIGNALAYGADNTGQSVCTVQLQAMLDAAAGGLALIPAGTYLVDDSLVVRAGTALFAYGATIRRTTVGNMLRNLDATDTTTTGYDGAGGIVVAGGVWDNAGATVNASLANCMTFAHAHGITVRDCTILDVAGAHGIELDGIRHAVVDNVTFAGYYDTGSRGFSEAIQVDTATGGLGAADNTMCDDVTVTRCWAGASAQLSAWPRLVGSHSNYTSTPHTNIKIRGNHTDQVLSYSVRGYGWSDVIVDGNTFTGGSGAAIMLETPDVGGAGGGVCSVGPVTIRGNTISDCGNIAISTNAAVGYQVTGAIITGNVVTYADGPGIKCTRTVEAMVRDNRVAGVVGDALQFVGCTDPSVIGNQVRRGGVGGTVALSFDAACAGVWHFGNDFRGGQNVISDASTGAVTTAADLT